MTNTFRTLDKGISVYVAPGTGVGGGAQEPLGQQQLVQILPHPEHE